MKNQLLLFGSLFLMTTFVLVELEDIGILNWIKPTSEFLGFEPIIAVLGVSLIFTIAVHLCMISTKWWKTIPSK